MPDQQTEQKIAAYLREMLNRAPLETQQQQRQLDQKQEQDLRPQRGLSL